MSSKKPATHKNKPQKPSAATPAKGPRRLQVPKRIWYKPLTWRNRQPAPVRPPLPKARKLFAATIRQLWRNKAVFGGIALIYGALNLILVRGISGSESLTALKVTFDALVHGVAGKALASVGGFMYLLTTSGSGDTAQSGVYQVVLFVLCSLAFIWALRQTTAKHAAKIKDSFYNGMYPLIPFCLVFLLGMVQLLPLTVGTGLYTAIASNDIAVHAWEKLATLAIFLGLVIWSLRMVTATIFAAYIVTLPNMTPLRAYRSARELVRGRRLLLWRKIIFLPVALFVLAILIEAPLILFLTPAAPWAFFVIGMLILPLVHGYMYALYREML